MTNSTVDSESAAARRREAWLTAVTRRVRRDGFALVRMDGKPRVVVYSYIDGFNLVSRHGIPVRLAMLRGLLDGVREAMREGPLGEDYEDLYGIWCGLHILHNVVKRKKLVWGRGDKVTPQDFHRMGFETRRLLSRTKSRARKKSGDLDLLSLIPHELRPYDFSQVNIPRLFQRARHRVHRTLFEKGPALGAHHLHLSILQELHISYRQPWTPETQAQAKRLLASNRPVKVGERDLVYRSSDLAQLLAFYGIGRPAPVNRVRRYHVDYWNLEILMRLQATPKLLDLRTIPWMRDHYIQITELPGFPAGDVEGFDDAPR